MEGLASLKTVNQVAELRDKKSRRNFWIGGVKNGKNSYDYA